MLPVKRSLYVIVSAFSLTRGLGAAFSFVVLLVKLLDQSAAAAGFVQEQLFRKVWLMFHAVNSKIARNLGKT